MLQKTLMALALATSVFAAGCGGSSDSVSGGSGGSSTTTRNDVAGPLDAVQEPVSSQVLAPLATAAAGTPLEGVVMCVDQIVVGDTLDIVDTLAAQADSASPDFENSAAVVQEELTNLVADLQTLLIALAGGTGCSDSTVPAAPGSFTTNPLAGTPLASLGSTLLSVLGTVQGELDSGASNLQGLSDVVALLSTQYNTALAQLPAEATTAPVLGSALDMIGTALQDLNTTVAAAESADAAGTALAASTTVDNLLTTLLLDVVPLTTLEEAAGQTGALSGPIGDAIDQITALIAGGFGNDLGSAGLPTEVEDLLGLITDPGTGSDPTELLTDLLAQITTALGSGDTGALPIPDVGGAELDTALAELSTLLATAGDTGTPLDGLIDTVVGILDGLLGGII